jgi:hypothetical protein
MVGGAAFVMFLILFERIAPAMNWTVLTQNSELNNMFAGVLAMYVAYRYGWRNKRFAVNRQHYLGKKKKIQKRISDASSLLL